MFTTETAVTKVYNDSDSLLAADVQCRSAVSSLSASPSLSAAFDTAEHQLLLHRAM